MQGLQFKRQNTFIYFLYTDKKKYGYSHCKIIWKIRCLYNQNLMTEEQWKWKWYMEVFPNDRNFKRCAFEEDTIQDVSSLRFIKDRY